MPLANLSIAIEQSADSVLITDNDGVIEYVNASFEAMSGYCRQDAVGQTPRLLRSGVQTPRFYETLWHTILSGRPFHCVLTNRRQDGSFFDEEHTITPIRDADGTITHFMSTGREITRRNLRDTVPLRRQLEQEARRVAGLLHAEAGQYLALAHLTLSEAACKVDKDAAERLQEARGYLDRVEEHLRLAARGVRPPVVADLGLVDALKFIAETCARRSGMLIAVESSLDIRPPATAETLLFVAVQEALADLTDDASATTATITLAREVSGRRADDDLVSCTVRSNGAGIDVAAAGIRGPGASDVARVRDRLEAVGGTLTVRSVPGEGTEFRMTVPVEV